MSETGVIKKGITRRSFLKTTAAVGGVAALSGTAFGCSSIDYGAFATAEGAEEKLFDVVCRPNCFAFCRLKAHVREGKIVKTSPAQFEDSRFKRICLRGLSHPIRIYNPDRVKYPMKRAGERGENKWERITWEEALTTVGTRFKEIQEEYGPQAVSVFAGSGNNSALNGTNPGIFNRLFNVINATVIDLCVDYALMIGLNRVTGNAGPWVGSEPTDMVNAKTIIAWGSNLTDAQIQEWHFVADALEGGTKLIVIDPVFTQLAAKADRYIPIQPGTDPALFLSCMQVIISENAQDDEYLKKNTVAPFLVNKQTGKFLRQSDMGIAPTSGPIDPVTQKPTVIDPAMCWDNAAGKPVVADQAVDPALEGTYSPNGIECNTAYDLLKEEVNKYPPEVAEKITKVSAETIIELAHIALDGPVTHRVGWGAQAYLNGVHSAHAGITLCALTGNIGKPGASFGANWNRFSGFKSSVNTPTGPRTSSSISHLVLREVMRTGNFKDKPYPIKALYVAYNNPVCTAVDTKELLNDVFDNLDFIVVADSVFSDTVRYADIVLPTAEWFEVEEITGAGQSHYLEYNEKAIEPLFEARSDADIIRGIATAMGVGEYFKDTDEEYFTAIFDTPASKALGITYEALKEKKAIRYFPQPYIAWENNKFLTPSGRMEFYVEDAQPRMEQGLPLDKERERLPRYFPPSEASEENELFKQYPLILLSERPRYRVHSMWFGNQWLRELDPEPTVLINPQDAKVRGIEDGMHVEAYNNRGHSVAKAVFSNGNRPGVLVFPKSWQSFQHIAGSWSEMASSSVDPFAVNQNFMDNLCEIRPWKGDN